MFEQVETTVGDLSLELIKYCTSLSTLEDQIKTLGERAGDEGGDLFLARPAKRRRISESPLPERESEIVRFARAVVRVAEEVDVQLIAPTPRLVELTRQLFCIICYDKWYADNWTEFLSSAQEGQWYCVDAVVINGHVNAALRTASCDRCEPKRPFCLRVRRQMNLGWIRNQFTAPKCRGREALQP